MSARIMQDVPLGNGSKIKSGTKVFGEVVKIQPSTGGAGARVILRFDILVLRRRRIPVTTNLRALASMLEVNEAQIPETGPDRGSDEFDWNTVQIGGEADYHGSVITSGFRAVGKSVPPTGALVRPMAVDGQCRAKLDNNDEVQATWLFGANACGLYGFPNLTLEHAGRTDPMGEIVLTSDHGNVDLRAGSGMLLRVD